MEETETLQVVVIATGTAKAGKRLAQKLQEHGEVVNATDIQAIHMQREKFAIANDNSMANSKDKMVDPMTHSKHLHQKYNWGINPYSLQEGGFAYRFKFAAATSDDTVGMIRALSSAHPDLYFDVTFCRVDEDSAGILLFQRGDIVTFSSIEGEAFDVFHKVHEEIGEAICNEMDDPDDEEWRHDPESAREMHFLHGFF
jgi:hypothetical protein